MRDDDIFLDIETSWNRSITVIGFASVESGIVQLYDHGVDAEALLWTLPSSGRIFTFNGHSFDLPIIKRKLGIDLRERYESYDLMHIARKYGLRGGQKKIEVRLGISRETEGITGKQAMNLWREYQQEANQEALEILLKYNAEDVKGMIHLLCHLEDWGWSSD